MNRWTDGWKNEWMDIKRKRRSGFTHRKKNERERRRGGWIEGEMTGRMGGSQ